MLYARVDEKMKFFLSCSSCFSFPSEISAESSLRGVENLKSIHAFSYNQLKIATNGFRSSNKIGEGGFGSVYKGMLKDGKLVAVKVLSMESKKGEKEFMSEIASVANICHQNIVKLHGGCVDGPRRILVYDYMENNNLTQTLLGEQNNRAKFSWKARREIALGIARGLAYIHEEINPHIVHRDIKATNILLDYNFKPKLSDFGLSKLLPESITHISTRVAGTLGYIAPEYAISGRLTRKSDVYSFGVLLLEIVSGRTAVDFDLELGEHYLVEKAWEMYNSNKLLNMVDSMLNGNFSKEEAMRFLKVALLCVQENCRLRPRMSMAIKMMNDDTNFDDIKISKPGLINDLMDVKIGHKISSKSISSFCSPQLTPLRV